MLSATIAIANYYTVSPKNQAKLFLSLLCEISTNSDNFWQKDGKQSKTCYIHFPLHLTHFNGQTTLP